MWVYSLKASNVTLVIPHVRNVMCIGNIQEKSFGYRVVKVYHIVGLASHIPVEFTRKPCPVDDMVDILRWKATEFCLFMFYSGSFVIDFMLLFVEMKILCLKSLSV